MSEKKVIEYVEGVNKYRADRASVVECTNAVSQLLLT